MLIVLTHLTQLSPLGSGAATQIRSSVFLQESLKAYLAENTASKSTVQLCIRVMTTPGDRYWKSGDRVLKNRSLYECMIHLRIFARPSYGKELGGNDKKGTGQERQWLN
ncbi:uncharacterized protein C8R40DRAFT_1104284 [Lentinula edodes]|uniref:uncharacterized protein n=1 Tax=Lentinula edodes TaxID=5353 RepID=UPI001E8ED84F|nr:uncharacterized protein C8R40DRAFT_1104284 [Lentinula edodes]KAH7875465.1 hypothetical protein C8R40DRAFT_1104284 [Lentinula edodes]